jgi:acyl-CoA synthetase (AMP-forming)/AMP-acid ligase II
MRLIEKEKVTYFVGVPLMSYEIATHPDPRQVRSVQLRFLRRRRRAAPGRSCHADPRESLPHAFPLLGYGLTETNGVGCGNFNENYLAKPGSDRPGQRPLVELGFLGRWRSRWRRGEDRRDRDPIDLQLPGLLEQPRGDRGCDHSRRLVPHWRSWLCRRGRLPVHRRPQEGHHHPRRREHQPASRLSRRSTPIPMLPKPACSAAGRKVRRSAGRGLPCQGRTQRERGGPARVPEAPYRAIQGARAASGKSRKVCRAWAPRRSTSGRCARAFAALGSG